MSKRRRSGKKRSTTASGVATQAAVAEPATPERARPRPARREAPREVAKPPGHFDPALIGGLGAGLVAFVVYAVTLHPSLPTGDSGELISAAHVLGVAHPPGYPLYTLLGHAVMWLPFGEPAARMNLLSAALDAAAVAIIFALIHRLVGRRGWVPLVAATVGALLLAFSTVFWMYAVVAEVFALNNLAAALLLFVAVEWRRQPERVWLLWTLAFVFGLALTNQQTIVVLLPALVILAWRPIRRVRVRDAAAAIALFVVGLLPYLYLPLGARRDPDVNWGDPETFAAFRKVVTRADYGSFTLSAQGRTGSVSEQLSLLTANLAAAFVFVGLALAAVGLWWAWRNRRVEGLALAAAFVGAGPVFVGYARVYVADDLTKGVIERFYMLPSIPLGVLVGLGAYQTLLWAQDRRLPAAVAVGAAVALLAVPVAAAVAHEDTAGQRGNRVALHYAEDILRPLAPDALLLMRSDENYTSVLYAQEVERIRPDVVALDAELLKLPSTVEAERRRHPDVAIPFAAYDGGRSTSLADVVRANLGKRPVYYVGAMEEKDFAAGFDTVRAGFARRLLPKGQGRDPYELLRRRAALFSAFRFPDREYPSTSWESVIARSYGNVAFDLGYALHAGGRPTDLARVIRLYRTAIRLAPDLASAYKNLGVALRDSGADPDEVVAAWSRFLELSPNDPQADAIRAELNRLKSG
jgi:tetratricopeptide (TPR) repeat protein